VGMTVQIQTERGQILAQHLDIHQHLARTLAGMWRDDLERYRQWQILQYIDQWGVTVLNRPQQDRFVIELTWLLETETRPEVVSAIQVYRGLAWFCSRRVHTYLWMRGD
jgi:hypothetical protein